VVTVRLGRRLRLPRERRLRAHGRLRRVRRRASPRGMTPMHALLASLGRLFRHGRRRRPREEEAASHLDAGSRWAATRPEHGLSQALHLHLAQLRPQPAGAFRSAITSTRPSPGSMEKYCSVAATVNARAKIDYSLRGRSRKKRKNRRRPPPPRRQARSSRTALPSPSVSGRPGPRR
jgi:hypothetical protein